MASFLNIIFDILNSMLQFFRLGKKSISNSLNIYIKSNTGNTLSIELDPKWDIKNVKEVIAPKLGLPPNEVKIIFAGKELDDSITIEECDLGEQSILHAVQSRSNSKRSRPLSESVANLQLSNISENDDSNSTIEEQLESSEEKNSKNTHFYVYCSQPCKSVSVGKLRVRCASCHSGALTVDSDPSCWDDVLKDNRISAHCEENRCQTGPVSWAQFYFKCAEHTSQGEKDEAVPLYLIRPNISQVPCLACTDISDPVLVFSCEERHVTCLDCFRQYCVTRLRERQFVSDDRLGYTLPCPAGCEDSLIEECHHFRLLTSEQYQTYQRFGAEEFVLRSGGVLCPQPGCGAGILIDSDCKRVQCVGGCGFVFCRDCMQGYHLGDCSSRPEEAGASSQSYSVDPTRASQARWDEASKVAIRVTTKPCPKCRTATERDGGCMHMVCTRCKLQWCWVCQTEWTRDCMGAHWFG
ncbi:E3 ubiquitin-protein ligase parkin [Nilaparvata lugens]|uniref:E3 ubiquitin-protein ligase parkin n=1 Tax=Nilaparvata lugens TaxID=108931 RepID=UPI000B994185|nr:E3 ubiquitin-protein ligase parkin [Nilaparvata lugens]